VEDNSDTRTVMLDYLQNWTDLDVRTADNGVTALQVLGGFTPDLILLDLMMPGMDGVTFLTHLRNDPRYAQIRVVVVTAQELSGPERSTLDAQTLAIIEKGETLEGQLEQVFNDIGLRLPAVNLG
jgi:CheY-like chemotaxis protein